METGKRCNGTLRVLGRRFRSVLSKDRNMLKAFALFAVAVMLFSAVVPFLSTTSGSVDDGYKGKKYTVEYHPYYDKPPDVGEYEYNKKLTSESPVSVTYYGSIVSTEYNPQVWKGSFQPDGDGSTKNWYEISIYQSGVTVVFCGWAYAVYSGDTFTGITSETHYPGEVMTESQIESATDSEGIVHVYATWGFLNDFVDYGENGNGDNKSVSLNKQFSGGSVYTNIIDLGEEEASINDRITIGGNCTIRNGTISIDDGRALTLKGDTIIDTVTLIGYKGRENHGFGYNGIFANGNLLILGSGIRSATGNNLNQGSFLQVFGGSDQTKLVNSRSIQIYGEKNPISVSTMLIIHSGIYSNISGANRSSGSGGTTISDSVYISVRNATILDTLVGGSPGYGSVGGSVYIFSTGLNMPGDTYEENSLDSSIPEGVTLTESTILTGGNSRGGTIYGDTHVYLSGNSKVWDVQGAGRSGGSVVTGTAHVEVSGKTLVKHALCGSITDGNTAGDKSCVGNTDLKVKDSALVAGVFGAGYDTFYEAKYVSMMGGTITITLQDYCKVGYVYGGGYRGTIGTENNPIESITININGGTVLYDVFAGGRGGLDKTCHKQNGEDSWGDSDGDTTGYSIIYCNEIHVNIGSGAVVQGNVYGGGESVPVISKYDGYTTVYKGHVLGKPNYFSKYGVASVICSSIGITIAGEVGGSVYGAGKGVDVYDIDSYGRHTSAYIFAMRDVGTIKKIPWLGGKDDTGTTIVSMDYLDYASVSATTGVSITSTGTIGGQVYGGGALGVLNTGSVNVGISGGSVIGSVYGGGMGSTGNAGKVTADSITVSVSGGTIGGNVFGGGALAFTDVNGYIDVSITGGTIGGNVFGGGLGTTNTQSTKSNRRITVTAGTILGSVYGSSSLGNDSTANSEEYASVITIGGGMDSGVHIEGSVYGGGYRGVTEGSTSISIQGKVRILHSVYGGADVGDVSEGVEFDTVLVTGGSSITIDGSGGAFIGRSVFGSGNSCKVGGDSEVIIRGLVLDSMESIQNVTDLTISRSNISLSGRSDASSAQASTLYSINGIGRLVLAGGSTIGLKASAGGIGSYASLVSEVDDPVNEEPTAESSPKNRICLEGGHIFRVESGGVYGLVTGYTELYISVGDQYHGAFAYGSVYSDNGGFVVVDDGQHINASHTDFIDSKGNPYCRCWFVNGAVTYALTMVADGKGVKTLTTDVPVLSSDSYLVYTGYSETIYGEGYFQLPGASQGGSDNLYKISLRSSQATSGVFYEGIDLSQSNSTIQKSDLYNYSMKTSGIPNLNITMESPSSLMYTGKVATVVIHLWEATLSSEGTNNLVVSNQIDLKIDIYSEATDFLNSTGYEVVMYVQNGNGGSRFVINRSFTGYTASVFSVVGGESYLGVTMSPAINTEGTLGWATPLTKPVDLSSFGNSSGYVIGELNGSFSATIEFNASIVGSLPSTPLSLIIKLSKDGEEIKYVTIKLSIREAVPHNVTFVNRDEGLTTDVRTSIPVYHGETIPTSKIPHTWDNFVGWYSDVGCINVFDFSEPITKDVTVYALYSYVVIFDYMDGTKSTVYVPMVKGDDGGYLGTVSKPKDPIRENYVFDGWFDSDDVKYFGTTTSETIRSDTTYYAHWTGGTVHIKLLDSRDEKWYLEATVSYGSTYSDMVFDDVNRGLSYATNIVIKHLETGEFVRWEYKISSGLSIGIYDDTIVDIKPNPEDSPASITARFTDDSIKVVLKPEIPPDYGIGEEYYYGKEVVTIQAPAEMIVSGVSDEYTFSPGNAYFKGYYLDHWSYSINGKVFTVPATGKVTLTSIAGIPDKTLVLTPSWEHLEYAFVIESPLGGTVNAYRCTEGSDGSYVRGDVIAVGSTLHHGDLIYLEYTEGGGYVFSSWGYTGSGQFMTGSASNPSVLMMQGDCSVHVKLGGLYEYSLELMVNDVKDTSKPVRLSSSVGTYDLVVDQSGYYSGNARYGTYDIQVHDGNGWVTVSTVSIMGAGQTSVVYVYTVSVTGDEGRLSYPRLATAGSTINLTLMEGYKVDSFTTVPSDLGVTPADGRGPFTFKMPGEAVSIVAKTSLIMITVDFDLNGGNINGSTSKEPVKIGYFGSYDLGENPQKEGYTFGGWFVNGDPSMKVNDGYPVSLKADHTLKALWIPKDYAQYNVEIYEQDLNLGYVLVGTEILSGEVDKTVQYQPADREGFDINTSKSQTSGVVTKGDPLILKVYYDRKSYDVTAYVYYGTASPDELHLGTMYYGSAIQITGLKPGYSVAGIYSDASCTMSITTLPAFDYEPYQIYVQTQCIKYSISYNLDGGSFGSNPRATYDVDDLPLELPIPTRSGYEFVRWDGLFDGKTIPVGTTGDISVTAIWKNNTFIVTVIQPADGSVLAVEGATLVSGDRYCWDDSVNSVTIRYTGNWQVFMWYVDGNTVEGQNTYTFEEKADHVVYPYLKLMGDSTPVEVIEATVSFGLDRNGDYTSGTVGELVGRQFSHSLGGNGFTQGTVTCSPEGIVTLTGLGDATGSIRIFFAVGDGGSTDYIVHLTVNIVSDIVSANTEVSS